MKELMFNVAQEITSTIAGFVAVARNAKYKQALKDADQSLRKSLHSQSNKEQLSEPISKEPSSQCKLVLTKKLPSPSSFFNRQTQPKSVQPKARQEINPPIETKIKRSNSHQWQNPKNPKQWEPKPPRPRRQYDPIYRPTREENLQKSFHRRNSSSPPSRSHFPHPTKPNKFTLLCCRGAYDAKLCIYPTCNFFIFLKI